MKRHGGYLMRSRWCALCCIVIGLTLQVAGVRDASLVLQSTWAAKRGARSPGAAKAQPDRSADQQIDQQASQLLDRGISQLALRDLAGARQSLEQCLRLRTRPIVLYYLGAVAVADGRTLDAHDLMRRYLADPSLGDSKSEERTAAESILAQPRPQHGSLQILGDEGVLISVDQHPVAVLPLGRPLLLSPGPHRIALEAHGQRLEEQVSIEPGRPMEMQHQAATGSLVLHAARSVLLLDRYAGPLGEAQVRVAQALEQTLASEHYTLQRSEAALEHVHDASLRGCVDTLPCQQSLARAIGADLLLHVHAGPSQRATEMDIEVTAYSVDVRQPAATTQVMCPLPCPAQVARLLIQARLPELLQQALNRPRGTLRLTSQPVGAEVQLRTNDRWERLGLTPLEQTLWEGSYEVQLRVPGRMQVNRRLGITAQAPTQLAVEIPAQTPAAGEIIWERRPRPAWRIGLGAGIGAVGLALGIAGISALSINGSCVGGVPSTTAGAQCLSLYTTGPIGGGLLTAGLITMGAVVLTIAIPEPLRPRVKPAANQSPSEKEQRSP